MTFRYEDRGLTLRLFVSEQDAMSYPNAREPAFYAIGWIAKNEAGLWIDGDGVLPKEWAPDLTLMRPEGHERKQISSTAKSDLVDQNRPAGNLKLFRG